MERHFKQIEVEEQNGVFSVHLRRARLDESELEELSEEIARLIEEKACSKMVLNLGPEDPLCLYSVFLAKLVNLQRRLAAAGGAFALAGLTKNTENIFEAAGLHKYFYFYPDLETAIESLGKQKTGKAKSRAKTPKRKEKE